VVGRRQFLCVHKISSFHISNIAARLSGATGFSGIALDGQMQLN
jgi:hypothetical protein